MERTNGIYALGTSGFVAPETFYQIEFYNANILLEF